MANKKPAWMKQYEPRDPTEEEMKDIIARFGKERTDQWIKNGHCHMRYTRKEYGETFGEHNDKDHYYNEAIKRCDAWEKKRF